MISFSLRESQRWGCSASQLSTENQCEGSRKGLFIIDLDDPYAQPRFLPQGGTWEVADVQWNPHHSRSHYIVSTSSQKLLIWNLNKTGQTAIEFILNKHYRAITDVNWSSYNPDVSSWVREGMMSRLTRSISRQVIASCGIDSWIWAWDLRAGARTVFGMCAWDGRQDADDKALGSRSDSLVQQLPQPK